MCVAYSPRLVAMCPSVVATAPTPIPAPRPQMHMWTVAGVSSVTVEPGFVLNRAMWHPAGTSLVVTSKTQRWRIVYIVREGGDADNA